MQEYREQKRDVLDLFLLTSAFAKQRGEQQVLDDLERARQAFDRGEFFIAVCGEFKRGKSSLLGALLEAPEYFPVDVDIATNLVTIIRYGETERITVHLGTFGATTPNEIERAEISHYVTEQGNLRNAKQVQLLEIEAPIPLLQDGLIFADTPGIGGLNQEHTAVTYAYLPQADAVLIVGDVTEPFNTDEMDFIRRIGDRGANLLLVLTRADKRSREQVEQVLASNQDKVAGLLNVESGNVPAVAISNLHKLTYLRSDHPDPEDLADSNYPAFEALLATELLERRGLILLGTALMVIGRCVDSMERPLEAEHQAYAAASEAEREALERVHTVQQERLRELQSRQSAWRRTLVTGIADLQHELADTIRIGFLDIQDQLRVDLQDEMLLNQPDRYGPRVAARVNELAIATHDQFETQADAVFERVRAETGLRFSPLGDVEQLPEYELSIGASRPKRDSASRHFRLTRDGIMGIIPGGAVGASIATVIFSAATGGIAPLAIGGVGFAVGGVASAVFAYRESHQRFGAQERHEVQRQVNEQAKSFLDRRRPDLDKMARTQVQELRDQMTDDFERLIEEELRTTQASLKAVQAARQRSAEQARERERLIAEPRRELSLLRTQAESLLARAQQPMDTELGAWAEES